MNKTAYTCSRMSEAIYDDFTWDERPYDIGEYGIRKFVSVNNSEFGILYCDKSKTLYIAIRGTEVTSFNDILSDLDFIPVSMPYLYGKKVHRGFLDCCKDIYNTGAFEHFFKCYQVDKIVVTGHSLGAAIATLLSVLLKFDHENKEVELYTFGSPRVMKKDSVEEFDKYGISHYRYVNNNDVVTKVPNELYWGHCGKEMYIDRNGEINKQKGFWSRLYDGIIGRLKGFGDFCPDGIEDHFIKNYVEALKKNI